MRRTLGWLAGALGAAGALKALRGGRRPAPAPVEPGPDPRAEELRRRLDEAAPLEAEQPVDEPSDPDARRRDVHDRARAALEEMRRPDDAA